MELVGAKIRSLPCSSCPFQPGGLDLGEDKMTEIKAYLAAGQNHLCHSDGTNKTVCRGGRRFQLQVFHARGWIAEPTDEALREAMKALGIDPKTHV
jgi:hypothetical protein